MQRKNGLQLWQIDMKWYLLLMLHCFAEVRKSTGNSPNSKSWNVDMKSLLDSGPRCKVRNVTLTHKRPRHRLPRTQAR